MAQTLKEITRVILVVVFVVAALGLVLVANAQDEEARPFVGIAFAEIEGDVGLRVQQVIEGSSAEAAGVLTGDIIVAVDGEPATSESLLAAIEASEVGDELTLTISRDDAEQDITVMLMARPEDVEEQLQEQIEEQEEIEVEENNPSPPAETRPFIGVQLNDPVDSSGAEIVFVQEGSPAEAAGLQVGDIIYAINGQVLNNPTEVVEYVTAIEPGTELVFEVRRTMNVNVTVGETLVNPPEPENRFEGDFAGPARLGVAFVQLDEAAAVEYEVDLMSGALVIEIQEGSPAADAGVQVMDIILTVDGDRVTGQSTLRDVIAAYAPGDVITLGVMRGDESLELEVTLDSADGEAVPEPEAEAMDEAEAADEEMTEDASSEESEMSEDEAMEASEDMEATEEPASSEE